VINTLIFVNAEGYTPIVERISTLFQKKEIHFNLLTTLESINPNQINLVYLKEYPDKDLDNLKSVIISSFPKTGMYFPRNEQDSCKIELSEDLTQLLIQGSENMMMVHMTDMKKHLIKKECKICRI